MTSSPKKLILVIGATGAQGLPVVDSLLAPSADGTPSPYAVRALTRNPGSDRARTLAAKGVELFEGSFEDLHVVRKALESVYGAFVNTDGFTVGEEREIYLGIRIFEIAKQTKSIRHYVWSSIDNYLKIGDYDEQYNCEHASAKGRVSDWLTAQPSDTIENGLTWNVVCTTPYMDMLHSAMFGPVNKRADGTYVFATPVGRGHVPLITVKDIGFWARYSFDHREEVSAKELRVASETVSWDSLVSTFTVVTGKKAVVVYQSIDDWMKNFLNVDEPIARNFKKGDAGAITFRKNFSAWWATFRDDKVKRDMAWIRRVHPNAYTVEKWMRENSYTGDNHGIRLLKNSEEGWGIRNNTSITSAL